MVVFEFNDGHVMPLFDGSADDARNREFAKAVDAEGRRRVKAGLSDAGRVRLSNTPSTAITSESKPLRKSTRKISAPRSNGAGELSNISTLKLQRVLDDVSSKTQESL